MTSDQPTRTKPIPPNLRAVKRASEIPDSWWMTLFDGTLWRVDVWGLPYQTDQLTFRGHIYGRSRAMWAELIDRRISIRTGGTVQYLWVQRMDPGTNSIMGRRPLVESIPMAPVPLIPLEERKALIPATSNRLPNFDATTERLLADQKARGYPDVAPHRLARYPYFAWVAHECDCGTDNWRSHPYSCPVHQSIPLIDNHLRIYMSPEDWIEMERAKGWEN